MELRHLEYFATATQLGSVSKAAAVLNTTQPSLSRQIKALETELGHTLLERTSRGVIPTSAGAALAEHLENTFYHLERIPEVVRAAAAGVRVIRAGIPQGLPHDWFIAMTRLVQKELTNVTFNLLEATTEEQRRLLALDQLDIGFLHTDAKELEISLLFEQRIGVALPPQSPLAVKPEIHFHDFAGMRVMAHAVDEIDAEEARVRRAAQQAGISVEWVFRRFSEHSELIAVTAEVDAVLVSQISAERSFNNWLWRPLSGVDPQGEPFRMQTWVASMPGNASVRFADVTEAIERAASTLATDHRVESATDGRADADRLSAS